MIKGNAASTQLDADSHLVLAFEGTELPAWMASVLRKSPPAGFTLSRFYNIESAAQIAELTAALERENAAELPLLIAADQEAGQLQALGPHTTWFPGNMAIGATGDPDLAYQVGEAIGRELRALGVTVNYAPVCDLATNPDNPSLGIRSFGDDPVAVSHLASTTIRGLQAGGVIATAKHFPGKGEAIVDPHYELPTLDLDRGRLANVELAPFGAAVQASVGMIMTGHYSVPSVTGRADLPATLSRVMIDQILRGELGFEGVVITDALDMGAVTQGVGQIIDAIAALAAGVDLLLCSRYAEEQDRMRMAVDLARSRGLLDRRSLATSRSRIDLLRSRIAGSSQPEIDIVGCRAHRDLAAQVARRSITAVRNRAGLLPLRIQSDAQVLAVMPRPLDLTPADASSTVPPGLAAALRHRHGRVTEVVTDNPPTANEIQSVVDQATRHDLIVVGTISAAPQQAKLVNAILQTGIPTVTVALRTPFDLTEYPDADTHMATYSILPESLEALADVLFGAAPGTGTLPVAVPGLYSTGHGLTLSGRGSIGSGVE